MKNDSIHWTFDTFTAALRRVRQQQLTLLRADTALLKFKLNQQSDSVLTRVRSVMNGEFRTADDVWADVGEPVTRQHVASVLSDPANFERKHAHRSAGGQMYRKLVALAAALLLSFTVWAEPGEVNLAWDASTTPGVQYRLYAAPFILSVTNLPLALVKLDAGTNRTAQLAALAAGTWHFVATSYFVTNNIESVPSNQVTVQVPAPPPNMRTVVLQWNATVSGTNWLETGFFRIKFGDE